MEDENAHQYQLSGIARLQKKYGWFYLNNYDNLWTNTILPLMGSKEGIIYFIGLNEGDEVWFRIRGIQHIRQ
jgi:hypothetical protein